jgi:hypothetical protein
MAIFMNSDDFACSLKGLTLSSVGDVGRRFMLVHSVTLKHGDAQASPAVTSNHFTRRSFHVYCSLLATLTPLLAAYRPTFLHPACR